MAPENMNETDVALQKKFDLWMKEAYKHRILNEIRAREREWQKQQQIQQRLVEVAKESDGLMDMGEMNDIGIGDIECEVRSDELADAICALLIFQRYILLLTDICGKKSEDIAITLNISTRAVYDARYRARQKCKIVLQKKNRNGGENNDD